MTSVSTSLRLFLSTKEQTLTEAIRERVRKPNDNHMWYEDLPTADHVLYIPGSRHLLIPGEVTRGYEFEVFDNKPEELYVGSQFVNRFAKHSLPFPTSSSWVEIDHPGNYLSLLGTDQCTAIEYLHQLKSKGFDRFEIFLLRGNFVDSRNKPFLRRVRLKGIKERNFNKGGLCGDDSSRLSYA